MDEFNISSLSEAKGEYSVRLVNILSPHILDGIQSIFDNAKSLCVKQDEYDKYLMTFQNLLSRVINWNESLIQEEVERIIRKSQCNYIQELISSVHITQVKILTSVKLGNECKKISIQIPTINGFIHNVYIKTARKLYANVYLFEENILPLTYQKYRRECENIIQQSILDTIRDSVPVESILRSYLNDIEEDMEEKVEVVNVVEKTDGNVEEVAAPTSETAIVPSTIGTTVVAAPTETIEPVVVNTEVSEPIAAVKKIGGDIPEVTETTSFGPSEESKVISVNKEPDVMSIETTRPTSAPPMFTIEKEEPKHQTLEFNNTDKVLDMGTNTVNNVTASKSIDVLEKISDERYEQRKIEEMEDDEDSLVIDNSSDLTKMLNIETL